MPNFMHKLGSLVSKEADAATGKGNQKSASSKPSGKQEEKSELDKRCLQKARRQEAGINGRVSRLRSRSWANSLYHR
jgi:hypothetical protein